MLRVSPAIKESARNLLRNILQWNGVSYLPPTIDLVVKSDASETGLGGNMSAHEAETTFNLTASHGNQLLRTSAVWTPGFLYRHLREIHSMETVLGWFQDRHHPLTHYLHIQVLEALASFQTIKTLARHVPLQGKEILLLTDNTASAYTMAKEGRSKSPELSLVVRQFLEWIRSKGARLHVEHIPGLLNTTAVRSDGHMFLHP
jgi:hypothetical protein